MGRCSQASLALVAFFATAALASVIPRNTVVLWTDIICDDIPRDCTIDDCWINAAICAVDKGSYIFNHAWDPVDETVPRLWTEATRVSFNLVDTVDNKWTWASVERSDVPEDEWMSDYTYTKWWAAGLRKAIRDVGYGTRGGERLHEWTRKSPMQGLRILTGVGTSVIAPDTEEAAWNILKRANESPVIFRGPRLNTTLRRDIPYAIKSVDLESKKVRLHDPNRGQFEMQFDERVSDFVNGAYYILDDMPDIREWKNE